MDLIVRIVVVVGALFGYVVLAGLVLSWLETRAERKRARADSQHK